MLRTFPGPTQSAISTLMSPYCVVPRSLHQAILLPSGENMGKALKLPSVVTLWRFFPSSPTVYKWKSPLFGSCMLDEKMTPESSGRKKGAKLVPVLVSLIAGVARVTFWKIRNKTGKGTNLDINLHINWSHEAMFKKKKVILKIASLRSWRWIRIKLMDTCRLSKPSFCCWRKNKLLHHNQECKSYVWYQIRPSSWCTNPNLRREWK